MYIAIICFAALLVYLDVRMKFCYYFEGGRHRPERFDRLQTRSFVSLMSVLRTYSGMRIHVHRRLQASLPSQFMILSNHQSLLDIPILGWAFRDRMVGFVAKAELKRGLPALSFTLRKGRHALIPRHGDFRAAHRQLVRLAEETRDEVCPIVFPEGTRSRSGGVQSFHSAAVRTILARKPMPVLAVALDGGMSVSRLRDILKNLRRCRYRLRFMSLYPPPADRPAVQAVLRDSQARIARQVEKWRRTTR